MPSLLHLLLVAAAALAAAATSCEAGAAPDLSTMTVAEVRGLTFYQMLGVDPMGEVADADQLRQLKRAYRKVALVTHPDKFAGDETEVARQRFVIVAKAYETLKDDDLRAQYDDLLYSGRSAEDASDPDTWRDGEDEWWDYDDAYDTFAMSELTEEAAAWGLGVAGVGMVLLVVLPVYVTVRHEKEKAARLKRKRVEEMRASTLGGKRNANQRTAKERRREEELQRQRGKARERAEVEQAELRRRNTGKGKGSAPAAAGGDGDEKSRREARAEAEKAAAARPWTEGERSAVARLMVRFPGGTPSRWKVIAKQFNSTLPKHAQRPWTEVQKVAQSVAPEALPAAGKAGAAGGGESAWSAEDQRLFEKALASYPQGYKSSAKDAGGMSRDLDRWDMVAGAVPGKTRKQCVRRFKEIRARIGAARS